MSSKYIALLRVNQVHLPLDIVIAAQLPKGEETYTN